MFERKHYAEKVRVFTERLKNVLFDAYERMDRERERAHEQHPEAPEVNLISWPDLGSAEAGERAPQVHVVRDEVLGHAYVYQDGKFLHRVDNLDPAFWEQVLRLEVPARAPE
ncbi:MAG TPA: hypothetical protein VMK65_09795 [Longimicrobiales bacterium]|nr:hypothetical protein [Longimicrobiales bacterium]